MINAQDIRLGNYLNVEKIYRKDQVNAPVFGKVISIDKYGITLFAMVDEMSHYRINSSDENHEFLSPIQINETTLEAFGFEYDDEESSEDIKFWNFPEGIDLILREWDAPKGEYDIMDMDFNEVVYMRKFRFIHELQNLLYILKGTEYVLDPGQKFF